MIIQDLSHVESIATEADNIQGGIAFADAYSTAYASGQNFAATSTSTYTSANVYPYYYYYYGSSSASSSSNSSSTAA